MSRSKKTDDKAKDGATLSIDVDSFVRTRDSVVTGLATLQDAIQTLSAAYIKHTNAVLGEHGGNFDMAAALAKIGENPLLNLGSALQRAVSPAKSAAEPSADSKKERKKRQHDPDAPKRPLTPFFLYMQTARPIIAQDLGPEAAKGAVSSEGTQRWSNMDAESKQLWTNAYKENLRLYNARMHYYKLGFKEAKNMTDAEAATYAEENNLGDAGAEAQLVGEAAATIDEDAEGEPEKEPTPPPAPVVKTPKSKGGRKGKAAKAAAVEEPEEEAPPAPAPSVSIVPPKTAEKDTPKAQDKKRKRPSKKAAAEEVVETPTKEDLPVETPTAKSSAKPRKKKAKADA